MAMNMGSRGAGFTGSRPRPSVRSAYEDFKPRSEWVNEPGADVLHIHLPGFVKEQIRIVAVPSTGLLTVRGERFVAGNKWSRFHEAVEVPDYCDINGIRAKFEGGILKITMPKKIPVQLPASQQPRAAQPPVQPQPPPIPRPRPQDPQQPLQPLPPPPPPPQPPQTQYRPNPTQSRPQPTKPQQLKEDTSEKASQPVSEKQKTETGTKQTTSQLPTSIPRHEPYVPQHLRQKENVAPKAAFESQERHNHPKDVATMKAEAADRNENNKNFGHAHGEKQKMTSTEEKRAFKIDDYRKTMKGLSRNLGEDRQLLTNMGIAALVLVALGAYISYTITGSDGNSRN